MGCSLEPSSVVASMDGPRYERRSSAGRRRRPSDMSARRCADQHRSMPNRSIRDTGGRRRTGPVPDLLGGARALAAASGRWADQLMWIYPQGRGEAGQRVGRGGALATQDRVEQRAAHPRPLHELVERELPPCGQLADPPRNPRT